MVATRWVVRPRVLPAAPVRIFCFPYAGGGASVFSGSAAELAPWAEVLAVQLPGREHRLDEPHFRTMAPLVDELVDELAPLCRPPFVLYGHSLGALVAFELARALRRRGAAQPAHLFAAAHRAPQLPDSEPPWHPLPDAEFIAALARLGGASPALQHPELRALVLPTLRADFELGETYRYAAEPPLSCPITALAGERDAFVPREQVLPWREQTTGAFAARWLDDGHFFMQAPEVTRWIAECCARLA